MPPTLAAVASLPQLALVARTAAPLDVPIRWVAVSELADPTPYLEGGELLLTTGMRLTDPAGFPAYVERLARRGVAGLGLAVGLGHEAVPGTLAEAAGRHALPLLEVPKATPFIAIGKAVWRMLAAEQYEDVTRAFQAQRELTRAAVRGPGHLVARLARELRGWALLLDGAGGVRHAAPPAAAGHAAELAAELARLRHSPGSAALASGGGHVVVQTLGLGGHPRGFLAVGTTDPLKPVAHGIVGAAVSLLTLQTERPREAGELRATLAGLLLGLPRPYGFGEEGAGPAPGRAYGLPEEPVRVLACAGREAAEALEADPSGERCLALPRAGGCTVIAPERLAGHVAGLAAPHGPVGMSEPAALADAAHALGQAERALAAARRAGAATVLRHEDLPGQGLLALLDPGPARGFADALLAPLDPELRATLRAYLEAGGQGEAAARALGVHRHTLRHRTRRIAELLGRDLDDPGVRAELWFALAVDGA